MFGAIYSFLPIYLEVSISFGIFGFAEDRMHLGNKKMFISLYFARFSLSLPTRKVEPVQ